MILMSLLLAAVTFNPALLQRPAQFNQGFVSADAISPDKTCKPGDICAKARLPVNRNGCYVNNFWNNTEGGTPLTIDITETGKNGSPVYIYWVNATNLSIVITGKAHANYYCP
jgi:hypothetical protein